MDLSKVDPHYKEIETFLGLGRLAPFQYERSQHETHIRIFWKRGAVWLFILALLAWIALATALWLFVKYQRGFPGVRYSHMLFLPVKLDDYRREKGEFFIEEGRKKFAEKNYLEAFELMRLGLRSVPEDTEARRFVGDLYLHVRRPDLAQPLMVEGLPYNAEQLDYLQWVFASLFRFQEDDAVVRIAGEFLAAVPDASPNARHVVLMAEATAHFFRGRFAEARAVLKRHATELTQDGQLLLARMEVEEERTDIAVRRLNAVVQSHPANREVYANLIALLRQKGRHTELRRQALQRQLAFPAEPRAFIDELQALHDLGEVAARDAAIAAYLERFAADGSALDGLASFGSDAGLTELAHRLYEQRAELPLSPGTAAICLIESHLTAGRYAEAQAAIQRVTLIDKSLPDATERGIDALKAVAFFAQGDILPAQNFLSFYLQEARHQPELLLLTARRLEAVGARDFALQTLRKALEVDPLNQTAFGALIERDPEAFSADELRESLPRLLALRQPPTDLLRRLRTDLLGDRYLFFADRDALLGTLEQAGL